MSKIQKKIKELKKALEEVTGEQPNISINFHTPEINANFKKAKKMANLLTLDNSEIKEHRIWKRDTSKGIRLYQKNKYSEQVEITIFFK